MTLNGFKPGWTYPRFLIEGATVYIPYRIGDRPYALACRVLVACGDAGRVVNERRGIDRWLDRYEMAVRHDDPLVGGER